ncbi:histone deacetylase [Roseateles sp. BYS180W]|uniref:Histone deacetylase n=1 Tax=Roseateles rivi TaxID=3299028 RepID=A0ABW7FYT6_9BURK
MLAFYSDHHPLGLPEQHRFPQHKYAALREALMAEPRGLRLQAAPTVSPQTLMLAHTPQYIEAVLQGQLSEAAQREIGFAWSPALVSRSLHSVGATVAAAEAAMKEGLAANLAGGTHHAYADRGSGYCVFNDVAVAARLMQSQWRDTHGSQRPGLRVLVIDLDVHQGNGTAAIFRDDPSVWTFSMHGERNFPFRKEASDLDVGLPDGCTDAPYLEALDQALEALQAGPLEQGQAAPWLAFYLAGADPHEGDRIGRLKLSTEGMRQRDERVLQWLRHRRIPAALCMAGGYGQDVPAMLAVQCNTLWTAAQSWAQWQDVVHQQIGVSVP